MNRYSRLALWLIISFTVIVIATGITFSRTYSLVTVNGESMQPTFNPGDRIVFKKIEPQEDTYIVFHLPEAWKDAWKGNDDASLIKRVKLLPGDTLSWDGASWYKNGVQFSSISNGVCDQPKTEILLSSGQYFVTGDTTTTVTLDSREAFCRGLPYFVEEKDIEYFGRPVRVF